MSYREDWFRANKSPNGLYRCRQCGGWFPKKEIDIDHIIPQNQGGTDDLWNLQPMCKHCNRSKQDSMSGTGADLLVNGIVNVVQGNGINNVGDALGSFAKKQVSNRVQEALGIKKKRRRK